jgi:hypothetical protein
MPPDEQMIDLIEGAFLEGQIDGIKADLAHLSLLVVLRAKAGTFAGINTDNDS